MQKTFLLIVLLSCPLWLQAQEEAAESRGAPAPTALVSRTAEAPKALSSRDSLSGRKRGFIAVQEEEEKILDSATIDMYVIQQWQKAATIIDTSLTIQKAYQNNYLRKDYFELLPFVNMGHAFNRLGHDFTLRALQPQLGAASKHMGYVRTEDVKYYRVPTSITELFFRTTMEQGQLSDAVISFNTSPQFNFAIAYRGMRSLGKYVNQRSADEAFRIKLNFTSTNKRYTAKFHYLSQTIDNQENGGITPESALLFASGDEDFLERSVLDVRLKKAENFLKGKRSFLAHRYALAQTQDGGTQWSIDHQFVNESKRYIYTDTENNTYFGPRVYEISINDKTRWALLKNRLGTTLENNRLGKLSAGITYSNIDHFFELPEGLPEEVNPLHLDIDQSFLDATYDFNWRGFDFQAHFNKTITGEQLSDEIRLLSSVAFTPKLSFNAKAAFINRSPDQNFVRYRSNYAYYNWYNTALENEKISHLSATLSHAQWGAITAQLQRLENYTFYNQVIPGADPETGEIPDVMLTQVVQAMQPITYLKLRYRSHYPFWKFALTTTAQYQVVQSDEVETDDPLINILHVPEWNVRTTLSFSSDLFNKALYIQAGVTGSYFSAYYADAYNPLLGDFMRQDQTLVGDYPRLDAFVNARIQRTRIYLTYEHANAAWTGYDYYSAPNYPYRDSLLRLGVVWNFFD